MPTEVVCTACSREKKSSAGLLPARERYLGTHIAVVEEVGQSSDPPLPLYIISGLEGLVSADELVPHYDYPLTAERVPHLAQKIRARLHTLGVRMIHLHTKLKDPWPLYHEALKQATEGLPVAVAVHILLDSA